MLNVNIHSGLDKKEIRDFLAKSERNEGILGRSSEIEYLEKELERIKERLNHAKNHRAIITLIELNGWQVFGVSDDIPYDKDTYFPFIGTEEEFKMFYDRLLKESLKD